MKCFCYCIRPFHLIWMLCFSHRHIGIVVELFITCTVEFVIAILAILEASASNAKHQSPELNRGPQLVQQYPSKQPKLFFLQFNRARTSVVSSSCWLLILLYSVIPTPASSVTPRTPKFSMSFCKILAGLLLLNLWGLVGEHSAKIFAAIRRI